MAPRRCASPTGIRSWRGSRGAGAWRRRRWPPSPPSSPMRSRRPSPDSSASKGPRGTRPSAPRAPARSGPPRWMPWLRWTARPPAAAARALAGRDAVIGVSAATVEEAVAAERAGADYLGVGAVFATTTKADAGAPIGLDRLREIRRAVRLPVVGIGGITADNAAAVIRAGAAGVAVTTAVSLAHGMAAAAPPVRGGGGAVAPRKRP